jgi:hypothetical protein
MAQRFYQLPMGVAGNAKAQVEIESANQQENEGEKNKPKDVWPIFLSEECMKRHLVSFI